MSTSMVRTLSGIGADASCHTQKSLTHTQPLNHTHKHLFAYVYPPFGFSYLFLVSFLLMEGSVLCKMMTLLYSA